jgi:hypothetical protein
MLAAPEQFNHVESGRIGQGLKRGTMHHNVYVYWCILLVKTESTIHEERYLMSGRYRCARRQSRKRQLVRSAIDENGDLEHET